MLEMHMNEKTKSTLSALPAQRDKRSSSKTINMQVRTSRRIEALGIPLPGMTLHGIESQILRAPPLPIQEGQEVIVINGDKSNLTWKKYKLQSKDEISGTCFVVAGNERPKQVPISVVKPKDYIKNFKKFYKTLGDDLEFYQFLASMKLLGADYTHSTALKIFQSLDVNANGVLPFKQFINWVYGLGRQADRGRLLTTLECIVGTREFEENLPYYIMEMKENALGQLTPNWLKAKLNVSLNSNDYVVLVSTENNDTKVKIPNNLKEFDKQYLSVLKDYEQIPKFIPSKSDPRELSVIVMGGPGVGKSALLNKFVKSIFPHEYDPTIQDTYRKQILVDNKPALLDLLDTAGQVEFASMRYDWLRDGIDMLMLCFTRASRKSFDQFQEHLLSVQRLLKQMNPPRIVPIVLVGTKSDLEHEFEVSQTEIDNFCQEINGEQKQFFIKYVDCSALTDKNIEKVFETVVTMYREWRDEQTSIKVDKMIRSKSMMDRERMESVSAITEEFGPRSRVSDNNNSNPALLKVTNRFMKCLKWSTRCCPSLSKYFDVEEEGRLLIIGRVPKDKFPDDLAPPIFSVRHFTVQRTFYFKRFIGACFCAIFFPILLALQSILFLFYCKKTNIISELLPDTNDYTDPQTQIIFDYLSPIVGRDPRDETKQKDSRKWFLSQTIGQKFSRLILTPVICILFILAWYNGSIYVGQGRLGKLTDGNRDNDKSLGISVMEYLGPLQLWLLTWLILAFYVALDIRVHPDVPTMQELRPFVLYFGNDESLRTTSYVFLRGFAKSTFEMYRLEATWERIIIAWLVSVIYSLIPGLTRQAVGDYSFFSDNYFKETIIALVINLLLTFVLVLGLLMQLMSGLQNYIEWMEDVTSLLDFEFSNLRRLPYLNLSRQSNSLSWIEMRTYLFTKGLIIFSRQEIFVGALVCLLVSSATYILYRLLTDKNPVYESETFNGLFFIFIILCYALLRMLRYTRIIEKIQTKQVSLLANQKLKAYYKRVTYHPPSEEGNEDDDFGLLYNTVSEFDDDNDDAAAPLAGDDGLLLVGVANKVKINNNVKTENMIGDTIAMVSVQNETYFKDCETLLDNIIDLVKSQDIIPRVFNMQLYTLLGITTLGAMFAVIPTAIKTASAPECS